MNNYQEYAQKVEWLWKTLTGMVWLKLTYIKSKSDWIDTYTNYLSSKFFPKKENITQYDIEERFTIIESALQEYKEIENEIRNDQYLTQKLKEFLIKKIKESANKAEIAKRSIFFEAEKSGYDILIEWSTFEIKKNQEKIEKIWLQKNFEEKKHIYIQEIDDLQTKIYGPKISEIEDEKSIIISICNEKYQKNKQNLSQKEKEIFEIFLEKFKENIWKAPQDRKKLPSRGNISMKTIMEGTEHIKKSFYPNISNWEQIKEEWKTWYAVPFTTKKREYPDKDQDNFNKILTTIGHEDGWHMVRWDNQEKNWLIITWAWYEDIEEGITKLNEWLLKYNLEEYPLIPNNTFIAVFIWENYNFKETYELIKIIKKLETKETITKEKETNITKSAFELTQRVKCYYPRDENGSNRKDVIYFRGERKLVEYLKSLANDEERAIFYRKAMSAKVSFEDIFTIDGLLEELWTSAKNTNENKLVDKIFNVKLNEWAGVFNKIINKNWTNNIHENLLKWDFRFKGMEEYKNEEKKALVNLFTMVNYKKYRGKYVQEGERKKLKTRDNLKKRNIVSVKTDEWQKKGKIIWSNLTDLKILLQENGNYHSRKTITIKKKDKDKLKEVRILNKQQKE
jgi:hypothetical protein